MGIFPLELDGLDACGDGCVSLTERESNVCRTVCDSTAPVSFTQLKTTTSLHQEILSRIIRRLLTYGLVSKTDGGYRSLCCKAGSASGSQSGGEPVGM